MWVLHTLISFLYNQRCNIVIYVLTSSSCDQANILRCSELYRFLCVLLDSKFPCRESKMINSQLTLNWALFCFEGASGVMNSKAKTYRDTKSHYWKSKTVTPRKKETHKNATLWPTEKDSGISRSHQKMNSETQHFLDTVPSATPTPNYKRPLAWNVTDHDSE